MFAFFLATGDMAEFIPAVQGPKVDIPTFNSLAHNSSVCFRKAIALIVADPEVLLRFTEYFDNIMRTNRVKKGIKAGTTIAQYITDFTAINSFGPSIKAYIYDQPLVGWRTGAPKQELWDSFTQGGGSYLKKQKRKTSRRKSKKHRRSHR
jgi:hypothetical protein